jgi:hypothetical protein
MGPLGMSFSLRDVACTLRDVHINQPHRMDRCSCGDAEYDQLAVKLPPFRFSRRLDLRVRSRDCGRNAAKVVDFSRGRRKPVPRQRLTTAAPRNTSSVMFNNFDPARAAGRRTDRPGNRAQAGRSNRVGAASTPYQGMAQGLQSCRDPARAWNRHRRAGGVYRGAVS